MSSDPLRGGSAPQPTGAPGGSRDALLALVTEASTRLARVMPDEADAEIRSALQRLVDLLGLDRCVLCRQITQPGAIDMLAQACRQGREPLPAMTMAVAAGLQTLDLGGAGSGAGLQLPAGADTTVDPAVALLVEPRVRALPAIESRLVQLLCESIGATLRWRESERTRLQSERFERLATELSSRFASVKWEDIDQEIERSLTALLAFTDADQCGIYMARGDRETSTLTHLASRRITVPKGTTVEHKRLTPWLWEQVFGQLRPTHFSSPSDLPPEAATDRLYLDRVSTHSALYIPYRTDGTTVHTLAIVFQQGRRHTWSPHFIDRLKVLGPVFAGALTRAKAARAWMRARATLDASHRFAKATLDALNEYVCVVDAQGVVVEANDAWSRLGTVAGFPMEDMGQGGRLLDALESTSAPHAGSLAELARGLHEVLCTDRTVFELESAREPSIPLQCFKASVRQFVVDDRIYAAVALQDITERRRSDDELADLRARHWHADRVTRTGVLVASLAHELSQPLSAILSNAQAGLRFLRSGTQPDWQEVRDLLGDVVADVKRAVRVIDSLRTMMKRQATVRRTVDMTVVARDVAGLLRTEFIKQRVDFELQAEDRCLALADRAQMQQVMINLALNGMEAMEKVDDRPRRLRIAVSARPGEGIRVSVSDSGAGLTQAQLRKAFEAFWTTKERGTGLGLAICHSIVTAHGGRLSVEPGDGVGSTLVVSLPSAGPEPLANAA